MFRRELGKKVLVAGMHTAKKEHDLKNRGYGNGRAGKGTHVAFEPRPKFMERFLVALRVVEKRKKSSEGVRD